MRRWPGRWSPQRSCSIATNSRAGSTISKKLDLDTREAIYGRLQKVARIGVGMASVEEIDQINIYWARMLAMTRAVEALGFEPAWVLVDGNATPRWQRPSKAIIAGDAKCRSIAAASIVAKVTRDRIMADHARDYPGYGWETNRGYPTPEHIRATRHIGFDAPSSPQFRSCSGADDEQFCRFRHE